MNFNNNIKRIGNDCACKILDFMSLDQVAALKNDEPYQQHVNKIIKKRISRSRFGSLTTDMYKYGCLTDKDLDNLIFSYNNRLTVPKLIDYLLVKKEPLTSNGFIDGYTLAYNVVGEDIKRIFGKYTSEQRQEMLNNKNFLKVFYRIEYDLHNLF